jgi:cell division protein FtsI (penicillin-binding protein 3)
MYDFMKRLGFGSRTESISPANRPGILRPVARWQPASMGSLAIGQEVAVTPLQMAAAYSVLANNGSWIKPHIVRELRNPDGGVTFQAKIDARPALKAETCAAPAHNDEGVTLHGTARKAQLEGYTAAGKTGTAQKIDPKTHGVLCDEIHWVHSSGFAPVSNPGRRYHRRDRRDRRVLITAEMSRAPVFREIAEQVLPELNVEPDIETNRCRR